MRERLKISSQYQLQQTKKRQKKGLVLLICLIFSLVFLGYAMLRKGQRFHSQSTGFQAQEKKQGSPLEVDTSKQSCQSSKKNEKYEQPFSQPFIQSQYYGVKAKFNEKFSPPKIIWMFESEKPTFLQQLNIKNIYNWASGANYTVKIVNSQNYSQYFLKEVADEIDNHVRRAEKRKESFFYPHQNAETVKIIIILTLLEQYGGIYMEDTITMTEGLEWLSQVHNEDYVNCIDRYMPMQFFAFHDVTRSSSLVKPKFRGLAIKHPVRIFPSLQTFFMATYPRNGFLAAVNKKFRSLLKVDGKAVINMISRLNLSGVKYLYGLESYRRGNLFSIASYLVLGQKQKEFQQMGDDAKFYALDYYGVRSINRFYFVDKIDYMMDHRTVNNTYYYLARVSLQELTAATGPLKYMVRIAPLKQLNQLMAKGREGDKLRWIYKGSFLQKFVVRGQQFQKMDWIVNELDLNIVKDNHINKNKNLKKGGQNEGWTTLPKIVWVFWGKGIQNSSVSHQLCSRRIRAICQQSGFQYNEVSKANLNEYLDNRTISLIYQNIQFSTHLVYEQTFSDFVRLALILKHGGIYMDASFVPISDFTWLTNIINYPSQFVYNRFGKHPKVFMFFNPQYITNIFETKIDKKFNTKSEWRLAYENNFIAAEPNSQLLSDWLDEFSFYHQLQHSQIKQRFKWCGLVGDSWSSDRWSYLYEMDAIRCVISKKNKQLLAEKNMTEGNLASEYYGIWSMNGYNSVQKFRAFTNFENPNKELNVFAINFDWNYVTQIIGEFQLVKFFGWGALEVSQYVFSHQKQIDYTSFLGRFMMPYRESDEIIKFTNQFPVYAKRNTNEVKK